MGTDGGSGSLEQCRIDWGKEMLKVAEVLTKPSRLCGDIRSVIAPFREGVIKSKSVRGIERNRKSERERKRNK